MAAAKDTAAQTTNDADIKKHEASFMAIGSTTFNHELLALVKSRQPLIFVTTNEEQRFICYLQDFCAARSVVGYAWDCYKGLCNIGDMSKAEIAGDDSTDPDTILNKIIENIEALEKMPQKKQNEEPGKLFVLLGFDRFIKPNCSADTERRLKHIARKAKKVSVILVGPSYCGTPAIEKDLAILDFPYPNENELKAILWQIVESDSVLPAFPGLKERVEKQEEELINSVKGMTITEAQLALSKSIVLCKMLKQEPLDVKRIIQEKRQIIRKNGVLEYFDTNLTAKDVGGLDVLMEWLKLRKLAFTHDARTFGLDAPRGILLIGHPGVGKSLTAKATASEYGIPLLRLDFGRLFGSLVGDSERNARDAIALAEAIAPCVSGQSIVYDTNGRSYFIDDLFDNGEISGDFYINSLNEETYQIERTPVMAVSRKTKKPMIALHTNAGTVEVTKDHKMLAIRDGHAQWVRADSLNLGDFLITPKCFKRDIVPFDIYESLPDMDENGEYSTETEEGAKISVRLSDDLNIKELFYLIGMIDASGDIDPEDGMITFGSDDKTCRYFCRVVSSLFGVEPSISDGVATIRNPLVFNVLWEAWDVMLSQPDECVQEYLTGFADVSGKISTVIPEHVKVCFITPSPFIKERVRRALNVFGILNVNELDDMLFVENDAETRSLCSMLDFERHALRLVSADVRRIKSPCVPSMDYVHLGRRSAILETEAKEQQVAVSSTSDVVGVRLLKITEAGTQWCYDLSCKGNHNFFANGLCCHNCVLWTDELEKGLSGSRSSGDTDGGTTSRVISTFLTWMQEKTAPVFVMATANNVEDIPPEFMRAGRFDECFFVGLPGKKGREQIAEILLRRKGRDPKKFNLKEIAERSDRYSGAEIEKAIQNALFSSYSENRREPTTDDIVEALTSFEPLSKTREEEFKAREEWATGRCIFANTKELPPSASSPTKQSKAAKTDLDLN